MEDAELYSYNGNYSMIAYSGNSREVEPIIIFYKRIQCNVHHKIKISEIVSYHIHIIFGTAVYLRKNTVYRTAITFKKSTQNV